MRGKLLLTILNSISEFSGTLSDHVLAFLTAGYGASVSRLEWEAIKHSRNRERANALSEQERKLRHTYQVMIHKLKKDGLIQERMKNGRPMLDLTGIGSIKLRNLKNELDERINIPAYDRPVGKTVIIVSFDIPEEKRYRSVLGAFFNNV